MPDTPESVVWALLFVAMPEAEVTDPEMRRFLREAKRLLRKRCLGLVKLPAGGCPHPGPCPAPPPA